MKTIAFFDSGVGGLALLKSCMASRSAHYIYYADTKNMPYGNKSPKIIQRLMINALDALDQYKPDQIVLACFSASNHFSEPLRLKYPHVLTMFDFLGPRLLDLSKYKKIGIIATQATVAQGTLKHMLQRYYPETQFIDQACPLLALLIQNNAPQPEIMSVLELYLQPLIAQSVDALFIGCTHYELIKDLIESYTNIKIISTQGLIQQLLSADENSAQSSVEFICTDNKAQYYKDLLNFTR